MAGTSAEELLRANIQAFNDGDLEAFGAVIAEDGTYDEPGTHRLFEGRTEYVSGVAGWKDAFSDARASIDSITSSGNTAVAELTWRATHDGDLQTPDGPIAATGNQITVRACMIVRAEGGEIKKTVHYFDFMTILMQIGAIPAPASAD